MEIEAKFSVPDAKAFRALHTAKAVGRFSLGKAKLLVLNDLYMDTIDNSLLARGYACRRRADGKGITMTLKGLGEASDGVHRREELDVVSPKGAHPDSWPDCEAKRKVLDITGGAPLVPLFTIDQRRITRPILSGGIAVAELCLDDVHVSVGDKDENYLNVEAELGPKGDVKGLAQIVAALRKGYRLVPETRSKFERVLAMVGGMRPKRTGTVGPGPLPIRGLFGKFRIETAHAFAVTGNIGTLFGNLRVRHGIPEDRLTFVQMAALLHDIGVASNPDRHPEAGKSILAVHPPAEMSVDERVVVPWTTLIHGGWFSGKRLKETRFSLSRELTKDGCELALRCGALLRIADGIDYSRSGSRIGHVRVKGNSAVIDIVGPGAEMDAERAGRKADLWHLISPVRLRFRPVIGPSKAGAAAKGAGKAARAVAGPVPRPATKTPPIKRTDTMGEAARKVFTFYMAQMEGCEAGTVRGEAIEPLHDMRVAAMRMRAVFEVMGAHLDERWLRKVRKGLRRTRRALGPVRDLDVFIDDANAYAKALPTGNRAAMGPLLAELAKERDIARSSMLEHLGSKRYSNFKAGLAQMLAMGDMWVRDPITRGGHARPHRVRDVVPAIVHVQLSAVRAYDEWVASGKAPHERFHRLRIQVKLLRYTLEFFKDALGPEAKPAIERLKALQDHLGHMHDTVVAIAWLEARVPTWTGQVRTQAEAYLDNRKGALERSLAEFPVAWSKVMAPDLRMLVDKALFALSHGKA